MKAISMDVPGGPEVLHLIETSEPVPASNEVTIAVAFEGGPAGCSLSE
jgi:NADPH:quinone reductase-like Zn-dependent oxidoreductase